MTRPTIRRILAMVGVAGFLACGQTEGRRDVATLEDVADDLRSRGEEIRRTITDHAEVVRTELNRARLAIEEILEGRPGASGEAARQARARAERVLERGAELLRRAGADRGGRAENWARTLRDGMTRLERSLDELTTRSGREHADS